MQTTIVSLKRAGVACFFLIALLAGCAKPAAPAKEYQLHGEIRGLDKEGHVATIKHDEIKGFMGAMTMGYQVKDQAEFSKLAVGDEITATVYVKDDDMWIGKVQKTGR